jgi:hypothetical protein
MKEPRWLNSNPAYSTVGRVISPLALPTRRLGAVLARWMPLWRFLALLALVVLSALLGASVLGTGKPTDAEAYWLAHPGPSLYAHRVGEVAFLYSPAIAQLFALLNWMPFQAFYFLLMALNLAALVWLIGPIWGLLGVLALLPVSLELGEGNINLLLAAALVAGTRRPGWLAAFPLTKVSSSVVLLYDAIAGRWGRLATALGVAAAVTLVSFALAPDLWFAWIKFLISNDQGSVPAGFQYPAPPLLIRLPVAALLTAIAARRSWPALLPVAAFLATPILWTNTATILLAVPRLLTMPPDRASA